MKRLMALLGCVLLQALAVAQDSKQRDMHEIDQLHQDPKAYIAMLDDPKRDAYQKPHAVITALNLKEGEVIAAIGAGSGYFTFRLAHHVGDTGRVYAVDVSPDMILHLNRRIRKLRAKNVVTILSVPDDPLLMDASIDRFFVCHTWHHIADHSRYLALTKKMLKPGGQIVMIEFKKAETPVGPPMEMRIDRDDLVNELNTNGFHLEAEHTFLPHQYFLVFKVKLSGWQHWAGAKLSTITPRSPAATLTAPLSTAPPPCLLINAVERTGAAVNTWHGSLGSGTPACP